MKGILPTLLASLVFAGCAQLQSATLTNSPSDWEKTLSHARAAVDAHNYFAADKLLDEYVRTHPGTREANEIAFWKAAYILDPANDHGSLSDGIARLDAYLADNPNGLYRNEATLLRRTAAVALTVSNGGAKSATVDTVAGRTVKDTVVVVNKSRDEEIANLKEQLAKSKDELAKVSAELDRIKKRLANPNG
ncbi:MAG TPA: hypothetical protein VJ852_11790 [Gemmatimonadaceae bacterium]|nr:hypothetical protein [Gemmatimonadaceae bacterium]